MPKGRESGMPECEVWESFFDPDCMLRQLGLNSDAGSVVEFGCGYGTFTIPAARQVSGQVLALEIDADMIAVTVRRATESGLSNLKVIERDCLTDGTGLGEGTVDFVMLFNILHIESPRILLEEARRILKPGGLTGIIHWRSDTVTPRGPSADIRPTAHQCRTWAEESGLSFVRGFDFDCCRWHWGLTMSREH